MLGGAWENAALSLCSGGDVRDPGGDAARVFDDSGGVSRQISVPDEVYAKVARVAGECHVPVEDLVGNALADQMAAREWVARRAARSNEDEFVWALDQAPDVAPGPRD